MVHEPREVRDPALVAASQNQRRGGHDAPVSFRDDLARRVPQAAHNSERVIDRASRGIDFHRDGLAAFRFHLSQSGIQNRESVGVNLILNLDDSIFEIDAPLE